MTMRTNATAARTTNAAVLFPTTCRTTLAVTIQRFPETKKAHTNIAKKQRTVQTDYHFNLKFPAPDKLSANLF